MWRWTKEIIGLTLGAPSIVSFAIHIGGIDIAPLLHTLVEAYRSVIHPVFAWLQQPFQWIASYWDYKLPDWLHDLQALSFIGAGLGTRYMEKPENKLHARLHGWFTGAFVGYSFLGLLLLPVILLAMFGYRVKQANTRDLAWAGWITAVVMIGFFGANWYLLSHPNDVQLPPGIASAATPST